MPKKSPKRVLAERVLTDPGASKEEKGAARAIIHQLDARSKYMSAYEKRRMAADPDYRDARHQSKAAWKKRNKEKVYAAVRRHHGKRYKEDPQFRIDMLMRSTINTALRNRRRKSSKYCQHLDWDFDALREHIESQFTCGMSWENWGEVWELDHVEPRSSFSYSSFDDEDFVRCWRLANLKPTLKHENREQGYALSNK